MAKNKKEEVKLQSFDIKVEAIVPTTLVYRVLAEDEQQALEKIKNMLPRTATPHMNKKVLLKAIVYNAGSLIIKLTKSFR